MKKKLDREYCVRMLDGSIEEMIRYATTDGTGAYDSRIVWSSGYKLKCFQIEGLLFDFDRSALAAGKAAILDMVNYSIANEIWLKWPYLKPKWLRAQDPDEKQKPDENGNWPKWGPPQPEAWVTPNLALIDDRWWREGVIDKAQVAAIFDKQEDWLYGSVLASINMSEQLLSIGAYDLIKPMLATPNAMASGGGRTPSPADRLGMMLADDPGQLHDPKSPVRKHARSIMKRNMESDWFMRSGGLLPYYWLRSFEWREGESGLSPREAMLRAYAYMPDAEPPPAIANEVASLRKIPI